ncbi:MAG TPA: plastocyanin/azurin family copper-binding protein [Solirubrobacteraceae bacterium]|nr:plastocyanin/azurin family copper-binding protein [Solirubrobacteraceae bacterium]
MSRILALLAAGAALLVVAGCGSSSSSSSSTATTATTPVTTAATTAAPAAAGTAAVTMQNITFSPHVVSVKVGQTVKWTNLDSVDHNVTATKGATFKSDNFGRGGTFTWKADKVGTISYVCTIHPGMDGTIIVTK